MSISENTLLPQIPTPLLVNTSRIVVAVILTDRRLRPKFARNLKKESLLLQEEKRMVKMVGNLVRIVPAVVDKTIRVASPLRNNFLI